MFGASRDDDDIARGKVELVLTFDRETRLASAEHITPEVGAARVMQRPRVWPAHSHHLALIEPHDAQPRTNALVHAHVHSLPNGNCFGMSGSLMNHWAVEVSAQQRHLRF